MECGEVRCVSERRHERPTIETSKAPTKMQKYFYKYFSNNLNILSRLRYFCLNCFELGVVVGLWSVAKWAETSTESQLDQRSIPAKPPSKNTQRIT